MAHLNQINFCKLVKSLHPVYFEGVLALDVGSLDINGNNKYLFHNSSYIGIDLMPGKNVDIITTGHELKLPDNTFDTIISTECFEHDRHYKKTLKNIIRLLKPGGLFLFSCATTGRPEHGTMKTTPNDAPFLNNIENWCDYYKNLTESDIRSAINVDINFTKYEFFTNSQTNDLYYYGIKAGEFITRKDYSFSMTK